MENIENKELLNAAIQNYEPFTTSQKKILSAMLSLATEGVVTISINALSELTRYNKAMVYKSLISLENDGLIKRIDSKQGNVSTYNLNYTRLKYLIEIYQKIDLHKKTPSLI